MWKDNYAVRLRAASMVIVAALAILACNIVDVSLLSGSNGGEGCLTPAACGHIYRYCRKLIDVTPHTRSQARGSEGTGGLESACRRGSRFELRRQRVLRLARSDPGEVRDAPARSVGGSFGRGCLGELRAVTTDLLQGAVRFRARRSGGAIAEQARTPRTTQIDVEGDEPRRK